MLVRAVELSPRAERQLVAIEAYYLKEAGPAIADRAVALIIENACGCTLLFRLALDQAVQKRTLAL